MPRNGSGTASTTYVAGPAGTVIQSAPLNSLISDIMSMLTTSIATDGQSAISADIPFGTHKLTGVTDGIAVTHAATVGQIQSSLPQWGGTSSGAANVFVIAPTPGLTTNVAGQTFRWIAHQQPTGASTLQVSSAPAAALTMPAAIALRSGEFATGAVVTSTFDGTTHQVVAVEQPGLTNFLTNPAMEVSQENGATSVSCPIATAKYPVDEWAVVAAGATMTAQQVANTLTGSTAANMVTITGAASGTTANLRQRIEALRVPNFKRSVTYSFAVFNNTGSAITPSLLLGTPSATDNFTTVTNRLTQALQSCANGVWSYVYFTVDVSAYTNIGNGLQVELQIPNGSLTSNGKSVSITEAKAEDGPARTFFFKPDPAATTALCQRYFFQTKPGNAARFCEAAVQTTTRADGTIQLPVSMRAAPTLGTTATFTDYGVVDGGVIFSCTSLPALLGPSSVTRACVAFTTGAVLTVGHASNLTDNTANAALLSFSARL